jgi:hypothetical protein
MPPRPVRATREPGDPPPNLRIELKFMPCRKLSLGVLAIGKLETSDASQQQWKPRAGKVVPHAPPKVALSSHDRTACCAAGSVARFAAVAHTRHRTLPTHLLIVSKNNKPVVGAGPMRDHHSRAPSRCGPCKSVRAGVRVPPRLLRQNRVASFLMNDARQRGRGGLAASPLAHALDGQ